MQMPRLVEYPVVLRAFEDRDAGLARSVAGDPLIPPLTTVPTSGTRADALAFVARQRDRLSTGSGYSFVVADAITDEAVGQIGLWLAAEACGYQREGLLRAWQVVGNERKVMYVYSIIR
ncbi:MAG: hypothetical protein ABI692_09980 [Terracoccus sp.]